jgi:hypothetical protein
MTKLEELKAAWDAATPGEWEDWSSANPAEGPDADPMPYRIDVLGALGPNHDLVTAWVDNEADAQLIALMKNNLPALLKAVEALAWIVTFCSEHPEWFGEGTPDEGAEYEWLAHSRAALEKLK